MSKHEATAPAGSAAQFPTSADLVAHVELARQVRTACFDALASMRGAADAFDQLAALGEVIADLADHTSLPGQSARIRSLAELVVFVAHDFSNSVDASRERVELGQADALGTLGALVDGGAA